LLTAIRTQLSRRLAEATRIFPITVSFGSVNSSISLPGCMSHKSIPAELAQSKHLPSDLVRLSVGIEEADDLLEDLEQALEVAPWVGARSGSGCGVRAS